MSKIQMAYPVRDLSELIYRPTLEDVPLSAQWWRIRVFPNPDGVAYVTEIDNMDNPTRVSWSWADDGRDEFIEPHAASITVDPGDAPFLGNDSTVISMPYTSIWLNALTVGMPTSNPRWEAVTTPGNHRHPEVMREIIRRREELGLPIYAPFV